MAIEVRDEAGPVLQVKFTFTINRRTHKGLRANGFSAGES
jgi:hypothetical protein